jgi:multiple sugar transport system substrate-binding protein
MGRTAMGRSRATRRALLAGAAAPFTACGLSDPRGAPAVKFGDPISISFWHTQGGANQRPLEELAAKFNQTNGKNLTVKLEYQGTYAQAHQKTTAAIQSGLKPDVASGLDHSVFEWARLGALVDLSDYVAGGPAPLPRGSADDLFPVFLSPGRYETASRRLYGMPFAKSVTALFVNDELMTRAVGPGAKLSGLSFDEFKRHVFQAARKERDGRTVAVYGHYVKRDAAFVDAFILANGGDVLARDQSKVRFAEAPGIEVFEMWAEMARKGEAYTSEGFNHQADFGLGKLAGFHDTSLIRSLLREEVKDRFKWSIGLLPQKDPAKPVTLVTGGSVAVFKGSAHEQAASWEWLKFLLDRDQTAMWSVRTGCVPVRKSAVDNIELKAHWERETQGRQAFELLRYARPEPNLPAFQEIRELLQIALATTLTGRSPAKTVLEETAKQANKVLDERR